MGNLNYLNVNNWSWQIKALQSFKKGGPYLFIFFISMVKFERIKLQDGL